MKGFAKVMIAGAIILAIGAVVLIVALGLNGWNLNGAYEIKTHECEGSNTSLDIEFSVGSLEISYYDGEKIKIEYPEDKNLTAAISEKDGKLKFATEQVNKWFTVTLFRKIPATKIYLPQGGGADLSLKMNAGAAKIADGAFGAIAVNMNAGALSFGSTTCRSLTVDMNAGAITVASVISAEAVKCDVSAGALNLGALSCPSLGLGVSAGACNIDGLTADEITVDLSAGSVDIDINGVAAEYGVFVDKSAGACNLSSRGGATDKFVRAKISAGSLDVGFTN